MIPDLPLHKADREAVQMILNSYLDEHQELCKSWGIRPVDRSGLELSLITYCAILRDGLHA